MQLFHIEPVIYRRFVVPASIPLDRLHDVIQIVMGWTDSHLHEFTIGKKCYTEYPESKDNGLVCGRYRLGDLIKQKGLTFRYLYDFGDGWEHELVLEERRYFDPELRTELACLEGELACPPEGVGGVPGYFEFCKALKDPNHEEHESYMEWSGGDFDSEGFSSIPRKRSKLTDSLYRSSKKVIISFISISFSISSSDKFVKIIFLYPNHYCNDEGIFNTRYCIDMPRVKDLSMVIILYIHSLYN